MKFSFAKIQKNILKFSKIFIKEFSKKVTNGKTLL